MQYCLLKIIFPLELNSQCTYNYICMSSFSSSGFYVNGSSETFPDSKVHVANMGPTWVLSSPGGPHDGPMNLAIRVTKGLQTWIHCSMTTKVAFVIHFCFSSSSHCTTLFFFYFWYLCWIKYCHFISELLQSSMILQPEPISTEIPYHHYHYKHMMVVRQSYFNKGNPYICKMVSLYWNDPCNQSLMTTR